MFGASWGPVLGACRLGAEWAWRQVYEDVAPSLLRYHRARGTIDPDDVVGDTFVRAVDGLAGFDGGEGEFRAWLFSISRNRAVDLARAHQACLEALLGAPLPASLVEEGKPSLGTWRLVVPQGR